MRLPALRELLLELAGTAQRPDLSGLTAADWAALGRMAAQHRIEPLLHRRWHDAPDIPEATAASWQAAHRQASLLGMVQRAELREKVSLLEAAGFTPIALKGAWLAWQAYPEPGLRPLRDIDLLLPPDQVLAAMACLESHGYQRDPEAEMSPEECVRLDKHLPVLIAPRGTAVELHLRLWELNQRLDHGLPERSEEAVFARAERGADGIAYPAAEDMLAHLVIHALYSHRLDCGPLILSDLAFLAAARPLDWDTVWTRAEAEGWRDGLRLLLDLVRQYRPEAPVDLRGETTPAELRATAVQLLLQDLDTRKSAGLAAATLKDGPAKLLRRLRGVNAAEGEATVQRKMATDGGRIGWATDRAKRTLRDLVNADVRRQSRQLAAISRWLDR